MYTYHHVISRLTEADKIRLLTDLYSLSEPEVESLGVPRVICASLREGCHGTRPDGFPAPAALARSWDSDLMGEVAREAARRLAAEGVNHVLVPPAGSAVTSDGERLSEDPHLSGVLTAALLKGVNQAGVTASLTGFGFTPADSHRMDTPASHRFACDHVYTPYATVLREGKCLAVILENHDPAVSLTQTVFLRSASERETVAALSRGELLVQGSASALRSALHTYRRLKAAIGHGKATMGELETAILEGEAMSEETLDTALDRLLTFAYACRDGVTSVTRPTSAPSAFAEASADGETSAPATDAERPADPPVSEASVAPDTAASETPTAPDAAASPEAPASPDAPIEPPFDTATAKRPTPPEPPRAPDTLTQRALDGATVLLENRENLLPLVQPARVCILGDLAREGGDVLPLAEALTARGHTYLGFARGYDPALDRDDALTEEAVALASEADVVLLFVGTQSGKSRLPAAQLALLDRVGRPFNRDGKNTGKKTVVILSSDVAPDMGFVRTAVTPIAGLILTPLSVKGSALHAVETVLGVRSPLGRLTETLTAVSDPAADRRGYKVGPFVGYRYYDTVGFGATYPFGHGLTYAGFRYSALKLQGNSLTFTVKNTGKLPGIAIPQVYVGIQDSAILRPKKELVGYTRVPLAAGEQTTVTLSWREPPADGASGLTEKGTYRVFVGESVSDIRLTATLPAGSHTVEPDGAALHEYLPSVSNIPQERYTLEAEYTPMKPSLRNLLFGIAALVLAVSVKIYDIVSVSTSAFLNVVAGLLAVGAVFFFVLEFLDRKKQFARERTELEEANASLFADATDIPVPSADALFELVIPDSAETEDGEHTDAPADELDHFLDANKELTFSVAASALSTLAAEKGLGLDQAVTRSLLAAMASSRLLILRGMSDERFSALTALLCEYFDCPASVDTVDEAYTDEAALLYGMNEGGELTPRAALNAVESARRNPRLPHIVALNGVTFAGISDYFVPYARYARAPHTACSVTTRDAEGAETAYLLPENLWFVLNLREGEGLHLIPDYMTEIATVLNPYIETVEPNPTHAEFAPFRYGQMLYLCDRLKATFSLEEDTWKRIDRLEAYAARFSDFSVTNKLWLGMEAYLAVLLADGADPAAALDETLAVKLLPALIPALSGNIPREERSLSETLDAILRDGNTTVCRMTVKESGADLT